MGEIYSFSFYEFDQWFHFIFPIGYAGANLQLFKEKVPSVVFKLKDDFLPGGPHQDRAARFSQAQNCLVDGFWRTDCLNSNCRTPAVG